ncbi:acyl-CoA carboxylase subunit epsilon [Streptomyces sp. NBC_01476]|uniref:acyl-CoA carboxylase subunit epsilon n=1 Tax=Streptomyces sp. NBC_01476 TaxID=2903881 RepID=UPI002E34FB38|nr:acyl-CoA carboxylase subunit epsilon [Streptomyces sp. NBC_01476]
MEQSAGEAVRVERGSADEVELAVLTVVLMSVLGRPRVPGDEDVAVPVAAPWHRWDRVAAYRSPRSWQ